jgi:hypothetical protein
MKVFSRSVRKQLRAVEETSWSDSMPFSLSIVCPWSVVSPAMVQYVCRSDMIEVGKRHAKFSYHSQARTSSKFIERFGVITLLPTSTTAGYLHVLVAVAFYSMHFQCLNGGLQLVSPPMRTVVVGKPYVSPKAFSVSRRSHGPNVRPILHLGPFPQPPVH